MNYTILAQSAEDILDVQNSPSISMWQYLLDSSQTQLLNRISIYSGKGKTRAEVRLLYMNGVAVDIWKAMGKPATPIQEVHRPPTSATLIFGMPFSE